MSSSSEAYDSGIIETAEEVEVPEDTSAFATARSEQPPPNDPPARDSLPQLPRSSSSPSLPALTGPTLPPEPRGASPASWSALIPTERERYGSSLLQRATELARRQPALWLVAAPVCTAALLVLVTVGAAPATRTAIAPAAQVGIVSPPSTPLPAAPTEPPAAVALEAKDPASLSVSELLVLNGSRSQRQRDAALGLGQKLQDRPELAKDPAVQADLLRFAADTASASTALAAMALAATPVGPDLLFEVWTNRATPAVTAELASALLYSRDVRPGASPALSVALDLRSAGSCQALKGVLPQAQLHADSRSLTPLAKLAYRSGCGAAQREDCQPCLRTNPQLLTAAIKAANRRRPPAYPTPKSAR